MRSPRTLVLSTAAAGVLELAAGIYLLTTLAPVQLALFFCVSGVCTALLAGAVRRLTAPPRDDADAPGGGGPDGPTPPPWWPRFERDFRRYVAERDRTPSAR